MNQDEKDEFKEKATEEIARLADDIKHLENDTQPISPDVSLGRLTRMDAIQNKSVAEANLNAARSRLKRIESRLQKLDSPDFQSCINCGQEIPMARILYLLDTNTCLGCASAEY
ncbi:MAG: TraR/DksA C4-type zinc finger protein [Leptospiraceae bacterium]